MRKSDPRSPLLALLDRYNAEGPADGRQRDRIRAFVEGTAACFERSHPAGHITGSAWLVNQAGTHVLLTRHKKLNKWLQLGGHADGNPDVLSVALREAEEESGLIHVKPVSNDIFDLDVHPIPTHKNEPAHLHYDIRFALQAAGDQTFTVSDESHELAWVSVHEIERVTTEESLLRMARKWSKLRPN